jgi:PAS domain S-box-containing protein
MRKILAIDDQKDNLSTYAAVIKSQLDDCIVLTALSGQIGIELARKEQPDVILLDIIMPGMDGYETCAKLKADDLVKHIPVIMITAIRTDSDSRVKGLNTGADAFLPKPIDPIEFLAQVNVMLRIKAAEDKLRLDKEQLEDTVLKRTWALKESEKHLQTVFQAADEVAFITSDINGVKSKILSFSPGAEKIFGYRKEEIIGQEIAKLYPPELSMKFQRGLKSLKENLMKYDRDMTMLKKSGEQFPALLSIRPLKDDGGGLIGFLGVAIDISERKKAENALKESERKYRLLATNTLDTIWTTDAQFNINYINNAVFGFLGYRPDEILGMNPTMFTTPEGIKVLEGESAYLLEKYKTGEIVQNTSELQQIRKDGTIIDVEIKSNVLTDGDGNFVGFQGRSVDITQRKRVQLIQKAIYNITNAVATSGSLNSLIEQIQIELGAIIDTTNFYIALYDRETDSFSLPFINDEKEKLTSFPVGKTLTSYVLKTQSPLLATERKMKELEDLGEVESIGPNSKIWLGVPLKVEEGIIGVLAIQSYHDSEAYNASDLRMLEFVSGQVSISIERKKAEQDLIAALEKAKESEHLKSVFLATVSHELRTPLNSVIGFSDLINEDLTVSEVLDYAKTINISGNNLLAIVDDLFDISLIESGEIKIIKKKTNLLDMLNELNEIIKVEQQKTEKDHIDFKLLTPPNTENIFLNTDVSKLKQILVNLLKNALKFTKHGHVHYGYKIVPHAGNDMLEFFVEDTGIGIPEDKHEIIFDVFRQVEDSHTRSYGGTGIGLSISKKLTQLLGGEIWLESEVGKGTTFYFTTPFDGMSERINKQNEVAIRESSLEGKTILIVEDVESSFEFLKIVLEKSGMHVKWAKNGIESIKQCMENPSIDMVLMDINMPLMNGYDATIGIKKFRPHLPIIAQTAYAIAGDKEKSLAVGCDDYIAKPIKRDVLLTIIKNIFK